MNTKREYENRSWMKFNHPAVFALLLLLPVAAWAGGVVTNCTEADLRAAMAGGGTVTFACDGTIHLSNTITIVGDTRLDGSGRQVVISGTVAITQAVRVFYVNTNVNFTVVNLTIDDGSIMGGGGGGAIFNHGGTVNASYCSFGGNTTWAPVPYDYQYAVYGGAIRNEAGQVNLRSCAFGGNRASGGSGFGGAIHNSGTVTLDLCTFTGNSATGGNGFDMWPFNGPGGPGGEGSGAAIFNQGTLTVDRTTFYGNTATGGAGGGGGRPPSSGSNLDGYPGGAGGEAHGGAICNLGSCWVTRSTFASNVVTSGAGGTGGAANRSGMNMAGTGAAAGMQAPGLVGRCSTAGERDSSTVP